MSIDTIQNRRQATRKEIPPIRGITNTDTHPSPNTLGGTLVRLLVGNLLIGNIEHWGWGCSHREWQRGEWSDDYTNPAAEHPFAKHTFGGYALARGGIDIYMGVSLCVVL
jgi:hypothetical protein